MQQQQQHVQDLTPKSLMKSPCSRVLRGSYYSSFEVSTLHSKQVSSLSPKNYQPQQLNQSQPIQNIQNHVKKQQQQKPLIQTLYFSNDPPQQLQQQQLEIYNNSFINRVVSPLVSRNTSKEGNRVAFDYVERMQRSKSECIPSKHFSASEQFFSSINPNHNHYHNIHRLELLYPLKTISSKKKKKSLQINKNNSSNINNFVGQFLSKNENHIRGISNAGAEFKESIIWQKDETGFKNEDTRPITGYFPKHEGNYSRMSSRGNIYRQFTMKIVDSTQKMICQTPKIITTNGFGEHGIVVQSYSREHAKQETQQPNRWQIQSRNSKRFFEEEQGGENQQKNKVFNLSRLKEIAQITENSSINAVRNNYGSSIGSLKKELGALSSKSAKFSSQFISWKEQQNQALEVSQLNIRKVLSPRKQSLHQMSSTLSTATTTQLATQVAATTVVEQLQSEKLFKVDIGIQSVSRYSSNSIPTENYDICQYVKDHHDIC